MRLLVTGGAGFIGAHLTRAARTAGHDVVVLDDLSTSSWASIEGLDVTRIEGSILDEALLEQAMDSVDAVAHLAALASVPASVADPVGTHAVNVTGTVAVLRRAAEQGAHVSVASSSAVYGRNQAEVLGERDWVRPMSPYGTSKLAAEQYALAFQDSYGLASAAFRFFNVYGPGQPVDHVYAAVVPAFVDALLAGRALTVHGDGGQSRDFVNVATVCAVLLDAAERHLTCPEPVNLANGSGTTLLDLVAALEQVTGRTAQLHHETVRVGDVRRSCADVSALRALFPDAPQVTLTAGLAQLVRSAEGRPRSTPA
ncbi:MAG: NAD-dependent epimerase/dehydratase family protein [Mycobacteriaceae bacterium]